MKLFDCTLYYDEDLILETRLNILDKYFDKDGINTLNDPRLKDYTASQSEETHTYVEITDEIHEDSGVKF